MIIDVLEILNNKYKNQEIVFYEVEIKLFHLLTNQISFKTTYSLKEEYQSNGFDNDLDCRINKIDFKFTKRIGKILKFTKIVDDYDNSLIQIEIGLENLKIQLLLKDLIFEINKLFGTF